MNFYECVKDFKDFMKCAAKMKRDWLSQGANSNRCLWITEELSEILLVSMEGIDIY